ncbi:hypothetical protein AYK26_00220 [Euryarchaeota archaeon SM23-78]|nr:MAG: hypothetical protein AYK26_00220 [Euryarchaeota archaeon SM23-78]
MGFILWVITNTGEKMINVDLVQQLEGIKQAYIKKEEDYIREQNIPSSAVEDRDTIMKIRKNYFEYSIFLSDVAKERGLPKADVEKAIESLSIFQTGDDENTQRKKMQKHLKTMAYLITTDFPEIDTESDNWRNWVFHENDTRSDLCAVVKQACGNVNCSVSTTDIDEQPSFGSGKLDKFGFWEKPCYICAREFEKKHPEMGECWPYARKENKNEN